MARQPPLISRRRVRRLFRCRCRPAGSRTKGATELDAFMDQMTRFTAESRGPVSRTRRAPVCGLMLTQICLNEARAGSVPNWGEV